MARPDGKRIWKAFEDVAWKFIFRRRNKSHLKCLHGVYINEVAPVEMIKNCKFEVPFQPAHPSKCSGGSIQAMLSQAPKGIAVRSNDHLTVDGF